MRSRAAAAIVSLAIASAAWSVPPVEASVADGSPRWDVTIPGGRVHWSSPAIADVDGDGSGDVVVGGLDGRVHAYDADGAALPGWPAAAVVVPGTRSAVASSPAVGDIDGDGRHEVVVGTGSLEVPDQHGGVVVFEGDGSRRCSFQTGDKFDQWDGGGPDGFSDAVWASPALGDVTGDGRPDIVVGSWDHQIRVLDGSCRQVAAFDNTDTVWSAPALFDADGDGRDEIYVGGDATSNHGSHSGGFFRSLRYAGNPQLQQRWVRLSSEAFQTAPAIADIDGDGRLEVVTGAGRYYCQAAQRCGDSNKVWAFDLLTGRDVPGWPRTARYNTFLAAPAIGDVDGDGRRDVVIGSFLPGRGAVLALRGDGTPLWEVEPQADELTSPPVVADVLPDPGNEVVVASGGRVLVLDGRTGATLRSLGAGAYKNAAAVGELGPGRWALVAAGFQPGNGNAATIQAFDIPTPAATPWPMYGATPDRRRVSPLGPPPTPRPIDPVCPDGEVPPSGTRDVPTSSPHHRAVECAVWWEISQPADGLYRPAQAVTRAQMASFVARLIDASGAPLPEDPPDAFRDDDGSAYEPHEANIDRLAEAGVIAGRTATSYAPGAPVTRGQMATFLVRAHRHVTGDALPLSRSWFHDRDPVHGDNVDRAAGAGIATGYSNGTYRPGADVRRDQMASFLMRTAAVLASSGSWEGRSASMSRHG